jgi:hypothetical protein
MIYGLVAALSMQATVVHVSTNAELIRALKNAEAGTTVHIAAGNYSGGVSISGLHGTKQRPVVVAGADKASPPRFSGGNSAIQLSSVSYIELRDIVIERAGANGLNIDDGGTITKPSHHVTLKRIAVTDLPKGNHDGIKLSGLDDFRVEECSVARWGGSGIDMVGCHRGLIAHCVFRQGEDSGVQAKGGSSDIKIQACRFIDGGQRGVNIGGSTGAPYFRPGLTAMGEVKYEARNVTVEGCTFIRGGAAIAFVGADGATVRFNTFFEPSRWVFRILQETREPGFVPSRGGVISRNLVVFRSTNWASGGINIGSGTSPESFRFSENYWFCADQPRQSTPMLPGREQAGVYGIDPMLKIAADGTLEIAKGSQAAKFGAHAWIDQSPR